MKRLFSLLLRAGLFLVFIGYFIVAVIVNTGRLELWIHPLERFHLDRVECLRNGTICLGTYPDEKTLRRLQPATVVSLLNPRLPFSRELVEAERERCRKLGIRFVSIPVSLFSQDSGAYDNLLSLLQTPGVKKPLYIHTYLFDRRLESLKHRIVVKDKPVE